MKFGAAVVAMMLAVGAAASAQRRATFTVEDIILAEDRRAARPGDYELLTTAASSHADAAMRARAVRALGRLEQMLAPTHQPADLIERALGDPDAHVRRTAAYALAQSVAAADVSVKIARLRALLARLSLEEDDAAAGALIESAARLADAASVGEVAAAALAQAGFAARADTAASALEILTRRAGKPGVMPAQAVEWLRGAVMAPSLSMPARRAALQALITARAVDGPLAARAFGDEDWQLRRLALIAGQAAPEFPSLLERGLRDPDAHVRYEALRAAARRADGACTALIRALKDADAHVALTAIDLVAACNDPDVAVSLAALAAQPGGVNWHRASHALVSLTAIDARRARELLASHLTDKAWPVRMYAATAAARLPDDEALARLADDPHPNVREAAINGMVQRVKDPASAGMARERLKQAVRRALVDRTEPQLLRTAAAAVPAIGDASALKDALLEAIDAIDAAGGDTTIDARKALVEALKIAAPDTPAPTPPRRREPLTPSLYELRRLPLRARIDMARGGVIELELLPDEAPASVARFARLARAGYYNGLTFHRVVPNFVVQGGSPWANEYAGAPRFQRDELGVARHERGAVGISTRGRDTGDAQIFIDLVDLPRLNHDYTVFARVVSGIDVVDRILEADVIQRVTVLR